MSDLRFDIQFIVWGEKYTSLFLDFTLPSYLSPRNVPLIASQFSLTSVIYTTPLDADRMKSHPNFLKFAAYIPVSILPVVNEELMKKDSRYGVRGRYRSQSLKKAQAEQTIPILVCPDVLISDGGLFNCCELIRKGNKAINIAALNRANTESILPELARLYDSKSCSISLPSRDMIQLGINHLHEIGKRAFWHAENLNTWLSYVYWNAGNHSILAKFFHLHPIAIDIRNIPIQLPEIVVSEDGGLLDCFNIPPDKIYTVTNSDEVACLDLCNTFPETDPQSSPKNQSKTLLSFALKYTRPPEINYFLSYNIRFQGKEDVDWTQTEHKMKNDIKFATKILLILKAFKWSFVFVRQIAKSLGGKYIKQKFFT